MYTLKITFRLYQQGDNKSYSTFFDLIDGNYETKQTKGLAYLFSKFPILIKLFLKEISIQTGLEISSFGDIDFAQVDAEMLSFGKEKLRRDITLSLYQGNLKKLVIVIEAKSVYVGTLQNDITQQLKSYIDPINFPQDGNVLILGVTLTRYTVLHQFGSGFISLTWMEILNLIHKLIEVEKKSGTDITIAEEYIEFISGVGKGMKYYEVEVLSVAAGDTYGLTRSHYIHACPHHRKGYSYKKPIYITFRSEGGGEMEFLYKIDNIVVLDPLSPSLDLILEGLNSDFVERIKGYIKDRRETKLGFEYPGEEYRFYDLSQNDIIHLKHKPKPQKNNSGGWYYSIAELVKGEKIVNVIG